MVILAMQKVFLCHWIIFYWFWILSPTENAFSQSRPIRRFTCLPLILVRFLWYIRHAWSIFREWGMIPILSFSELLSSCLNTHYLKFHLFSSDLKMPPLSYNTFPYALGPVSGLFLPYYFVLFIYSTFFWLLIFLLLWFPLHRYIFLCLCKSYIFYFYYYGSCL